MSNHFRKKCKEDQGSSLISTLLLLVFLTFLMTASAGVIKNQVIQYKQTAHSYEAKALIEMTETLIAIEGSGHYPASVLFTNGKTVVEKVGNNRYTIKATLTNRYTSQKTIELPVKVDVLKNVELEDQLDDELETVEESKEAFSDD